MERSTGCTKQTKLGLLAAETSAIACPGLLISGSLILTAGVGQVNAPITITLVGVALLVIGSSGLLISAYSIYAARDYKEFSMKYLAWLLIALCTSELMIGVVGTTLGCQRTDSQVENELTWSWNHMDDATLAQWHEMQASYSCCGVNGPEQWVQHGYDSSSVPDSCCKPIQVNGVMLDPQPGCGVNAISNNSDNIFNNGCATCFAPTQKSLLLSSAQAFGYAALQVPAIVLSLLWRPKADNFDSLSAARA